MKNRVNHRDIERLPHPLLTRRQAARRLGVSVRTLELWASKGKGPGVVRLSSRCLRYRPEDVEAYVDEHLGRA